MNKQLTVTEFKCKRTIENIVSLLRHTREAKGKNI